MSKKKRTDKGEPYISLEPDSLGKLWRLRLLLLQEGRLLGAGGGGTGCPLRAARLLEAAGAAAHHSAVAAIGKVVVAAVAAGLQD